MDQYLKNLNKKKKKMLKNFNLKDQEFLYLKLSQALCSIYVLFAVFMNLDEFRSDGFIENKWQTCCLAMSKTSAFAMYPPLVVVFASKCRATLNFLTKTTIALLIPEFCTDSHTYHSYSGHFIAYCAWVHTLFHILRLANQGNMLLLVTSTTGITGLISIMVLPVIAFLMMYSKFKAYFNYEFRKALHYLYFIFTLSLCFHVPVSRLPKYGFICPIMGTVLLWYTLDIIIVNLFMTEKIYTPVFQVLDSGVQVTMCVSKSFQKRLEQGGYVYICMPWINMEWHAFSLFEVPDNVDQRQVFIQNVGNWTNGLHHQLKRNTHRPLWIQGPFASSFHHAHNYDNQILVATGIGITPILSTARAYMSSRRVNMIWIVREPDVLEFYLEYLSINTDGWLIAFYTGQNPLSPLLEEYWSHTNVRIIKGRPDLNVLIPGLIYGIESGVGLPETLYNDKKERAIGAISKLYKDVPYSDDDEENGDILEAAFTLARSHGFQLTSLIQEMEKKSQKMHHSDSKKKLNERLSLALSATNISVDEESSFTKPPKCERRRSSNSVISKVLTTYNKGNIATHAMKRRSSNLPTRVAYEPWILNYLAPDYVKKLDKQVLETWGLVFCGRNVTIAQILHNVTDEYEINMIEERHEW